MRRRRIVEAPPQSVATWLLPERVLFAFDTDYRVHGISIANGCPMVQLEDVEDQRFPVWIPAWYFEIVEQQIPTDWVCNTFTGELPSMVFGPEYMARDLVSYVSMVELDRDKVDLFWARIRALDADTSLEVERAPESGAKGVT